MCYLTGSVLEAIKTYDNTITDSIIYKHQRYITYTIVPRVINGTYTTDDAAKVFVEHIKSVYKGGWCS